MFRYRPGHNLDLVQMLFCGCTLLFVFLCSYAVSAQQAAPTPHVEFALSSLNSSYITCPGNSSTSSSSLTPGLPGAICLAPPTKESNISFGRCFYSNPVQFSKLASPSFSTMFSFTTLTFPQYLEGQGFTFFIGPEPPAPGGAGEGYLGWLNSTTNGDKNGRNFAVEFDLVQQTGPGFHDPSYHHVGINVNSLDSVLFSSEAEAPAFSNFTSFSSLQRNLFAWIDYNGEIGMIEVRLSRQPRKPCKTVLSGGVNLRDILWNSSMYMGFSSSSGELYNAQTTIWDWSFSATGQAQNIYGHNSYCGLRLSKSAVMTVVIVVLVITLCMFFGVILILYRRTRKISDLEKERSDLVEELKQLDYGARRYTYQEILEATRRFTEVVGKGGFGTVYKGNLANLKSRKYSKGEDTIVAVKRIKRTSDSAEDVKQMAAEVKVIGRLRHNNIVPLLGWCYDPREILLVYKYMENGDLGMHIFPTDNGTQGRGVLSWHKRMKSLRGVAKALVFLHEDFEFGVIHRDIKTRNVMLDHDFNALLGDFGLARLQNPTCNIQQSNVLEGTRGYMAPEYMDMGASAETDVYSFGMMTLVVLTGRHAIDETMPGGLLKWVRRMYDEGRIEDVGDLKLKADKTFNLKEMESVLKVGLFCCLFRPANRPSMSEVLAALNGTSSILSSSLPPQTPGQVSPKMNRFFMSLISDSDNSDSMAFPQYADVAGVSEYLAARSNTRPRAEGES